MSTSAKTSMVRGPSARRANSKQVRSGNEVSRRSIELPGPGMLTGVESIVSAPEYEFLQVNEGGYKPADTASRKLIRSHVMRNYFQEKKAQTNGVSSANSASAVIAKDKLKGRWRLGKQELPGDEPQPRRPKPGEASQRAPVPHSPSVTSYKFPPPLDYLENGWASSEKLILYTSPLEQFQANIIDPFDSLPVATSGHRTNRLVHFYQTQFNVNSLASNPSRTLYQHVMTDAGFFHGMLAIVALYMHGHCGIPVKEDILYHRGETMQVIHRGLTNPKAANLPMLVSTMVTITSFENLCGNYYTSEAHLKALRWLIESSGGIQRYAHNDSVPRAIAWAEYHYAAATRTVPVYRYAPSQPEPAMPEELLFSAAKDYPYALATVEQHGHTIYNVLRRLHILSLTTSSTWQRLRNTRISFRYAISNMLHEADYDLLVLAHQLKPHLENGKGSNKKLLQVCDALCAASQIFLFTALRGMPLGARVVEVHLARLRPCIQQPNVVSTWQEHASIESLLWVLTVTAVAATGRMEHLLAMNALRKACGVLEISEIEGLMKVLRGHAWNDAFADTSRGVLRALFRRYSHPLVSPVGRSTFQVIGEMRPPAIGELYEDVER